MIFTNLKHTQVSVEDPTVFYTVTTSTTTVTVTVTAAIERRSESSF